MFGKDSKEVKNLDPKKLATEKRANELDNLISVIEQLLVESVVTIGEWSIVTRTIDNHQNSFLINNKVQVYAKPDEGSNETSPQKQDN